MKKNFKIIGIVFIVLSITAYGVYDYLKPMAVETVTLEESESEVTFTESGDVVNSSKMYVYPLVAGRITQVKVKEGDQVMAGDVLAALDHSSVDYEIVQLEKIIEGYEAQLKGAEVENQVNIDTLKANRNNLYGQLKALEAGEKTDGQQDLETFLIDQSKDIYDRGIEDLAKYKILYDSGYISEAEYNEFETLVGTYEAAYNQSVIAAESTDDYYSGMKATIYAQIDSINKTLEKDLLTSTKAYYQSLIDASLSAVEAAVNIREKHYITAPISGLVDEVMLDNVNVVNGMEASFLILGHGELKIEVKVGTRDIDVVKVGDRVHLVLDRRTGDVTLQGQVEEIADSATLEISPLGVEERKVMVTIVPETTEGMNEGYDVDVKFIVHGEINSIVVPNSALYKKDGQDMAMIIEDGVSKEVQVTLGYELSGETIVSKGLSRGDMLIIDLDAKDLKVGSKVTSSNE